MLFFFSSHELIQRTHRKLKKDSAILKTFQCGNTDMTQMSVRVEHVMKKNPRKCWFAAFSTFAPTMFLKNFSPREPEKQEGGKGMEFRPLTFKTAVT